MRKVESAIPESALISIQKGTFKYEYKGIACLKNPFDLALYTRLLYELKPLSIIEIGSASGGSAVWFADTLRRYQCPGHIYSIDLKAVESVSDNMVSFMQGDALQLGATLSEQFMQSLPRPLLVIEDAEHTEAMTSAVLEFFQPHMQKGEYIVVEDGIVNDLPGPLYQRFDNGPNKAIFAFLDQYSDFSIDEGYCDFYGHNFTWCTNGFLKKTS